MQFDDFSIKISAKPAIEPVTVDEVKTHTRVSGDDQDDLIASWITTARQIAETYQRRAFIEQTIEFGIDHFPCEGFILLPRSPLIELKEIKYYTSDNAEVIVYSADAPVGTESDYIIDTYSEPGRVCLAYSKSWPVSVLRPYDGIKITYKAGYGIAAEDVKGAVKDAILLYCAWRFENRAGETNVIPQQFYDLLEPERLYL